MSIIFWVSSFLVIYPYLVYPLLLWIIRAFCADRQTAAVTAVNLPTVCLVVSAYNEERTISEKIDNCLGLDYPQHLLSILIVSDASDDKTDQIVNSRISTCNRICLLRQEARHGKTEGVNLAMKNMSADIVVFSDANAMYEPSAIKELVRHFNRPEVGFVVGSALYADEQDDAAAKSEGLYWKYELTIKLLESEFYSVVGGDGAIYAIRRELYWPMQRTDINDFVNPLQIVASGARGVFTRDARCYEYASEKFEKEFARKRRIVNRSWRAVLTYRKLFTLSQHSRFLFMLWSHKIIRWFALVFIVRLYAESCGLICAFLGSRGRNDAMILSFKYSSSR
jgi:glycosyltransferase involved in cell wall biosynthesis